MNMRMLGLVALLLATFGAQAQTRAWLDRDRIALGETTTLNVETDQGGVQPPDYAALERDFIVSGHGSRRSVQVESGQRRDRALFTVVLEPRREGVVTVPALPIGAAMTSPLLLTVAPGSALPARAGDVAFIEAEIESREPYVQQSIGYVLRLYYATPLVSGQLDQPTPDGASMQRIGSDLQYTRDVAGRRYNVVERRYQVVPERSGSLSIPGARFSGRGVGGFFDELLANGQRELRAVGAPQSLQVRAMPDGASQPWLPLQGLELRYVSTPQTARAGEAAVVVVEALADGAAASQMPELDLPAPAGAQVFAEPAQVDETFENGRLRSRIVRRFSVVPAAEGPLHLPGPRLAWWDVRAGVGRVASLPDLSLQVAAGAAGHANPLPSQSGDTKDVSQQGTGWRWLAGAFALLWLATLAWAWRVGRLVAWRPRVARSAPAAVDHPHTTPQATHRQLMQVMQVGDLGEVGEILCAMAAPPVPDLDALVQRLGDPRQCEAVAALQRARWGGGDAVAARSLLRAAFRDGVAWASSAGEAGDTGLPPLYPR